MDQEVHGCVLVCDDDDLVRSILVEMLNAIGYETLAASSGEECLELLAEHNESIGLLVIDQVMPGMTGDKVIVVVAERRPELPVIWLSGFRDIDGSEHIKVAERLQKPVSLSELRDAVQRHILAS